MRETPGSFSEGGSEGAASLRWWFPLFLAYDAVCLRGAVQRCFKIRLKTLLHRGCLPVDLVDFISSQHREREGEREEREEREGERGRGGRERERESVFACVWGCECLWFGWRGLNTLQQVCASDVCVRVSEWNKIRICLPFVTMYR